MVNDLSAAQPLLKLRRALADVMGKSDEASLLFCVKGPRKVCTQFCGTDKMLQYSLHTAIFRSMGKIGSSLYSTLIIRHGQSLSSIKHTKLLRRLISVIL